MLMNLYIYENKKDTDQTVQTSFEINGNILEGITETNDLIKLAESNPLLRSNVIRLLLDTRKAPLEDMVEYCTRSDCVSVLEMLWPVYLSLHGDPAVCVSKIVPNAAEFYCVKILAWLEKSLGKMKLVPMVIPTIRSCVRGCQFTSLEVLYENLGLNSALVPIRCIQKPLKIALESCAAHKIRDMMSKIVRWYPQELNCAQLLKLCYERRNFDTYWAISDNFNCTALNMNCTVLHLEFLRQELESFPFDLKKSLPFIRLVANLLYEWDYKFLVVKAISECPVTLDEEVVSTLDLDLAGLDAKSLL